MPRRRASHAAAIPSNVLPAPTTWAMSVPSGASRARAMASRWCFVSSTADDMPGNVSDDPS